MFNCEPSGFQLSVVKANQTLSQSQTIAKPKPRPEKLLDYVRHSITKRAKSKNGMQISGTPRESDNISVF